MLIVAVAVRYWYLGPLKQYWTFLMSALGDWPPLVRGGVSYVRPCEGCSRCYVPPPTPQWKWWHVLLPPRKPEGTSPDTGIYAFGIVLSARWVFLSTSL